MNLTIWCCSPWMSRLRQRRFVAFKTAFIAAFFSLPHYTHCQEDGPPRYTSSSYQGNQIVYVNHFKFSDHIFSLNTPPNWLSLYDHDDSLVRYQNRVVQCSIDVRQTRLNTIPIDENSALDLYLSKIQAMASPNTIKDARVRDIDMPTGFPQTYLLANTSNDPPTKMVTYLIYSPFLYEITMEVKDRLTGILRTDYGNLLRSIVFEIPSTHTVPPSNNPISNTEIKP